MGPEGDPFYVEIKVRQVNGRRKNCEIKKLPDRELFSWMQSLLEPGASTFLKNLNHIQPDQFIYNVLDFL